MPFRDPISVSNVEVVVTGVVTEVEDMVGMGVEDMVGMEVEDMEDHPAEVMEEAMVVVVDAEASEVANLAAVSSAVEDSSVDRLTCKVDLDLLVDCSKESSTMVNFLISIQYGYKY
jgi:hypothetical protein